MVKKGLDIPNGSNVFSMGFVACGSGCENKQQRDFMEKSIGGKGLEFLGRKGSSKDWIDFGKNNLYPQFLCSLLSISGVHGKIVKAKADLIAGDGLIFKGKQADEANQWYAANNYYDRLQVPMSTDIATFGALSCYIKPTKNSGGEDDLHLYKIETEDVRLGKPKEMGSGFFISNKVFRSEHWKARNTNKDEIIENYRFFTQDDLDYLFSEKDKKEFESVINSGKGFIYYDGLDSKISRYYSMPDYHSEPFFDAVQMDGELMKFDVNELRNGLSTGHIITIIREDFSVTDQAKERRIRQEERDMVSNDMAGSENARNITIVRATPPATGTDVKKPMQIDAVPNSNNKDTHSRLDNRKNTYMLIGHGIPDANIIGIPNLSASGFASQGGKMNEAMKVFMTHTIKGLRNIYTRFIVEMAKFKGFEVDGASFVDINNFKEEIPKEILAKDFTVTERRKRFGASPLTDEQKKEMIEFGQLELKLEINESGE